MSDTKAFLIWSHERRLWWGPRESGYVRARRIAGRYTLEDAIRICQEANVVMGDGVPNESIVPDLPIELTNLGKVAPKEQGE